MSLCSDKQPLLDHDAVGLLSAIDECFDRIMAGSPREGLAVLEIFIEFEENIQSDAVPMRLWILWIYFRCGSGGDFGLAVVRVDGLGRFSRLAAAAHHPPTQRPQDKEGENGENRAPLRHWRLLPVF